MKAESGIEQLEYRPFPNDEGKNSRQAQLEIPAVVRAMKLPAGARILEVGCGRGVALPVLDRLCDPRRLVGPDVRSPAALDEIARVLAPGGAFVYETKASQLLSHPVRSRGRRLPAPTAHGLRRRRWAMLWASRTKVGACA